MATIGTHTEAEVAPMTIRITPRKKAFGASGTSARQPTQTSIERLTSRVATVSQETMKISERCRRWRFEVTDACS